MPKSSTSFTEGNTASKTHGIYSFEAKGTNSLSPPEITRLDELRERAKTEPGRTEIKVEIIARLQIIVQKAFDDMASAPGGNFWNSGVVGRAGSYLAELRRWLESMPPDKQNVIDAEAMIRQYRDGLPEPGKDESNAPDS
jgi:hypothetical protein